MSKINISLTDGKIDIPSIQFDIASLENIYSDFNYDSYANSHHDKFREGEIFYEKNFTFLSLAVITGFEKLTLFLLSQGANPNAPNTYIHNNPSDIERGYFIRDTMTYPLHEAVMFNQIDCIKLLLSYKANINTDSMFGTPLILAIENKNSEIVKLLVEFGAFINIKDSHSKTPLHKAVEFYNPEIIHFLLEKGAEDAPDDSGKKPSDIASEKGYSLYEETAESFNEKLSLGLDSL